MIQWKHLLPIALGTCSLAHAATPPQWHFNAPSIGGATTGVFVFSPTASHTDINNVANEIYALNGGTASSSCSQQFTNNRFAILLQPGSYPGAFINVGYYTSVAGLGAFQTDTHIANVTSPQNCGPDKAPGALNTFWRSAENFTTTPTSQPIGGNNFFLSDTMVWATSQACPLRKVTVDGNLWLFQLAPEEGFPSTFCSGGFIADCVVSGSNGTELGGQQQFFIRNTDVTKGPTAGVWNYMYLGSTNTPPASCSNDPYPETPLTIMVIPQTPVIAEKPFISYDNGSDTYFLNIPQKELNKVGPSIQQTSPPPMNQVPFDNVYVTTPGVDTETTIQAQLNAGKHIIFSPGFYTLNGSLTVNTPGTVILGLGFPTLIPYNGQPCIVVRADQVRVGGVLLQAGPQPTPSLLKWGEPGDNFSEGYLYDCFTRIGRFDESLGANAPQNQVDTSVVINSPNIVCDNLWLWRADHDAANPGITPGLGVDGINPSQHGLVVNADAHHVTSYGLFAEHQFQEIVLWNGEHGDCYFVQVEYPYDVKDISFNQVPAYLVNAGSHQVHGIGVYSNFLYEGISPQTAIQVSPGVEVNSAITRHLNNLGGIQTVINGKFGHAVSISDKGPYPVCHSIESGDVRVTPNTRIP